MAPYISAIYSDVNFFLPGARWDGPLPPRVNSQRMWTIQRYAMIPSYLSASRNTMVPVNAENWANFSEYCRGAHYLPAAAGSYRGVVAGAEE
jgi:hypothetical protein